MLKRTLMAACVFTLANTTPVLGLESHSRRLAALLAREPRHEKLKQWLEAEGYESIPITLLKNSDHLVVAVSTNRKQLRICLDTGAAMTCLDPTRVKSMKLDWKYADDLPGGEKDLGLRSQLAVEFDGLEVGKFKIGRLRAYSVDLGHVNGILKDLKEDPLDGLLAGDALSKYAAVVDYRSMRLYLKRAKPSTGSRATELRDGEPHLKLRQLLEAEGYKSIQITRFKNTDQLLVPISTHQKQLLFALDTGAPKTCLDPNRVESMNLDWKRAEDFPGGEEHPKLKSQSAAEFDGIEVGRFKTGRVRMYSADLGRVNGILREQKEEPLDGILGGDVLSKYAAVVDFPSMRLFLKK